MAENMSHTITIQPKGLTFEADENKTILDAAAGVGIRMLKSCDNGVCEICRANLIAGTVENRKGIYKAGDAAVSPLLPCIVKARSDLILEQDKVLAPGEISLQHIAFQITEVAALTSDVYRIELLAPAGKLPDFHAGQYCELLIEDGEYPFTIASAPGTREMELHLGVTPDNESAQQILSYLQNNSTVRIRLPKGDVWTCAESHPNNLHDPLVFVVAGTGFAQAKAMIEEQLKHQHPALFLYWINKDCDGFYSDLPEQWVKQGLIKYRGMCTDNESCGQHDARPVEECMLEDLSDLSRLRVIACGGPGFVYSVLDGLESKGLKESQMSSDVFAYAPRPKK